MFWGQFGQFDAANAAIASLREIESSLTAEERVYLEDGGLHDPRYCYDKNRLLITIMGLQRVIVKNGGSLSFSRLRNYLTSPEEIYYKQTQGSKHAKETNLREGRSEGI